MKKLIFTQIIALLLTLSASSQGNKDGFFEDYTINIQSIPLNTDISDFGPCIVGDELLFSSILKDSPKRPVREGFYDLFKTSLNSSYDVGSEMQLLEDINTKYHEGPVAYCEKTGELFISLSNFDDSQISFKPFQTRKVNLKIEVAKKQNGQWVFIDEFQYNNSAYSVGHPAINTEGDVLIFVSDMPGGKGETDLYMCKRTEEGWSEPENMENINTSGKEFTPFISTDDKLYFASDGYTLNSGLDIYGVKLSSWNSSKPVKLPAPLNTGDDDFGFVINSEGTYGFFTSSRPGVGNDDIYKAEFIPPPPEIYLELSVIDGDTNNPLKGVTVDYNGIENLVSTGETIKRKLKENSTYIIKGSLNGYLDNSITIETKDESETIQESLIMYKKEVKKTFVLENIYYEFDKWDILPESAKELDKLVSIIKENPGLKVELGSHTDSRGTDKYNMKLSQKRSESAVNYIISKGIDKSQITAKGYGESMPHIKNASTEEEHQLNRRTTFTIIDISSNTPVGKSIYKELKKHDVKFNSIDADEIKGQNYRVQFYASSKEADLKKKFPELINLFENPGLIVVRENNLLKYQLGPYSNKDQAMALFNSLKKKGQEVLLVEYNGNENLKITNIYK